VMAGGTLRAALLFEDLIEPRRWRPEEIATMQTLAFAVARGLEQQDSADAGNRFTALQRQLERTELVAQLTGGIAHDFNNILFAITSHVQLLRQRTSEPDVLATLKDIDRVADGARGIVSGLLHAHRGEIEQPEPRPLFHEVDAAVRLAGRLLPRGVMLETDLGAAQGCIVRSTAQGIRQLVLNLVVNARDAVGQRGTVRVSCGVEMGSDLGPAAVLVVEDNGPGVPEELRKQVLQAFFTTKGDAGTGLGLAICNRVAQEAGGRMKLDRSPALGGLRASIWFPLQAEQARVVEEAPLTLDSDERLADVNRVLVVEDDDAIRAVLVAAFESLDIDVVARPDADEVDSILVGGPFAIDLLIMDIDLGGTSGIECLEALRAKDVRTPCLFVTGGVQAPPASLAPCRVLRKPFPLDALVGACRAVLNDAATRVSEGT
jgi:signal transduction histidine kinase/ActR/RegA family two-component response regulator